MALLIYHESRQHTIRTYTYLKHTDYSTGSFYFSPTRDVLWLCPNIADKPRAIRYVLRRSYGSQLNLIKNILMAD